MVNQTELKELKKGEPVEHFLLVKKSEIRLTKAGKEFLTLELSDKSLSINANIWDNIEPFKNSVKTGIVIKISGSMDDFQGMPQIKVKNIRLCDEKDGVTPQDFLAESKRDPAEMKKEFYDRLDKIKDQNLKQLLENIFNEETFKKYSISPAGKSWHHSYIGGLLEHTLEIVKICDLMADIHPDLNRDLLITGAILHDFAKTEELSSEPGFEYTDKGKLIGHIVLAAIFIDSEIKKIENFPDELKNCLLHLVLSHQGKLEHASPVLPKTVEAIALYHADELSAKVNAYKNVLKTEGKADSNWTRFIHLADTDLYKHNLDESSKDMNKTLFD